MSDDGIQVWAPMEVVEGLLARAEKAEAQVQRVRHAAQSWADNADHPAARGAALVILRALDGDSDE